MPFSQSFEIVFPQNESRQKRHINATFMIRNVINKHSKQNSWAITLEENNIKGEGLEFSQDEIEMANEKSGFITNYISNFYGDVNNSQLQRKHSNMSTKHK